MVTGILCAALIMPKLASADSPWWNGDWQFRKAISFALPRDATANHFDPTTSTAKAGVAGMIGNGVSLGGSDFIRLPAQFCLAVSPEGGLTFASWVQLTANSPRGVLYSQAQADRSLEIGVANGKLYAELKGGKHTDRLVSTTALANGR